MSIKSFEKPLIELSHNLVFKKAKFIDSQYKLSIADLSMHDRLQFLTEFLNISSNLDNHIQEYLDDACMDRMYAESQGFGGFDE
jgi:hypothetical protein